MLWLFYISHGQIILDMKKIKQSKSQKVLWKSSFKIYIPLKISFCGHELCFPVFMFSCFLFLVCFLTGLLSCFLLSPLYGLVMKYGVLQENKFRKNMVLHSVFLKIDLKKSILYHISLQNLWPRFQWHISDI